MNLARKVADEIELTGIHGCHLALGNVSLAFVCGPEVGKGCKRGHHLPTPQLSFSYRSLHVDSAPLSDHK